MHNLTKDRMFVSYQEPGWHYLGTVVQEDISVEAALTHGIDVDFHKVPIGYTLPGGQFVEDSGKRFMVLSEIDGEFHELGVVAEGYTILSNLELARGLDRVRSATGWGFETVGALGADGATTFMTLSMGPRDVKGDKYLNYLLVADGKANGRALSVQRVKKRVVCENTLMAAEASAISRVKIAHDAQIANSYDTWLSVIPAIEKAQEEEYDQLNQMASVKIGEGDARAIIDEALPLPVKNDRAKQADEIAAMTTLSLEQKQQVLEKLASGTKAFEDAMRRTTLKREAAFDFYTRFNAGKERGLEIKAIKVDTKVLNEVRETPYAVLQSITELVDHGGTMSHEVRAVGALFGEGAEIKRRAWGAALVAARR